MRGEVGVDGFFFADAACWVDPGEGACADVGGVGGGGVLGERAGEEEGGVGDLVEDGGLPVPGWGVD